MQFRKYDIIQLREKDLTGYTVTFDTYLNYTVATKFKGFYKRVMIITPDDGVYVGSIGNWDMNFDSKHAVYNLIDKLHNKQIKLNEEALYSYTDVVKGVKYYDYGIRAKH